MLGSPWYYVPGLKWALLIFFILVTHIISIRAYLCSALGIQYTKKHVIVDDGETLIMIYERSV